MNKRILQMKTMAKAMMISLLLGVVGVMKGYALPNYDFSAVCETGQTLYYKFLVDGHYYHVELVEPGYDSWSGFEEPTGTLIIPEKVVYRGTLYSVVSVGNRAFFGCSNLTAVILPNSITSIGYTAFCNCTSLTIINIPNGVSSIGVGAFNNTGWFNIQSDGILYLDSWCLGYKGNKPVNSISLQNGTIGIANSAFNNCNELFYVSIPNSVAHIGENAFNNTGWYNAQSNGVLYLDDWCLGYKGSKPTNLFSIQNGTRGISNSAFQYCSGITSISIPSSIEYIGKDAFYDCYNIIQTNYLGTIEQWCGIGFGNCNSNPMQYSNGLFINNTELTSLVIPQTITSIKDFAFYNCKGLVGSIIIPNSVISIGESAFSNCDGINAIEIPNSVTSIGEGAFEYCTNISTIDLPNSITKIENYTFDYCENLTSISVPNTVILIGNCAFEYCYNLISFDIPENMTYIGAAAFWGCSNLTSAIEIPNSVTTIGEMAFCFSGISSIDLGNSITSINGATFNGCNNLTSVVIPNSVTIIEGGAFENCENLTDVLIPNSVTFIGDRAFSFTNISSLTIPNSVTHIGEGAFSCCFNLTGTLIIPNSVTTIGVQAFHLCESITSLVIGKSVNYIEIGAFNCPGLTSITVFAETPPTLQQEYIKVFAGVNRSIPVYVPYGTVDVYTAAYEWNEFSNYQEIAYKSIPGYSTSNGNWQFIASPLAENTAPTEIEDMIPSLGTYDLYRFDQSEEAEWRNYKAHTNDFTLTNGQGYLYANAEDVNLIFKGEFNEDETKEVELAYDANADLSGWNLVGNPFPVSAYANRSYYVMNEDGTAIEPTTVSSTTPIAPCTGLMVKAEATGESVTFSRTAPDAAVNQGVLQIALSQVVEPVEIEDSRSQTPVYRGDGPSTSSGTASTGSATALDKAIVSFNAGDRLEKFVFNEDNATLSIPQGGKDFAIANAEKMGEMPLNFKAVKNGEYTITVNPEAVEMDYLHLIDNMTGADIDLLATPSYTFNAKTTDYESRFKLVFSTNNTDGPSTGSGTFAFISNGNIIINGEGTLQLIDMAGRIIVSVDEYTRSIPTAGMTSGVYVLRLIERDDVKTQKIVVR